MSVENSDLERARAVGQSVAERLSSDEPFRQSFIGNPAQALLEAGMPPALLGAALEEMGATKDEVEGYVFRGTGSGPASGGSLALNPTGGTGGAGEAGFYTFTRCGVLTLVPTLTVTIRG